MKEPIDVVITWVDGQDSQLAARRRQYAHADELKFDDVGGVTRYASIGEIFWCVASINRFAPWVHRIYIVTDGQDPHLTPFLEANFPEGYIPVEIVDHKQIFQGYEQFLPTFNSRSISTMFWRVPGLSRHFIEINDDVMLCAPVAPDDFFLSEGIPVCYAYTAFLPLTRLTRIIKRRSDGKPRLTFKGNLIAAAMLAGKRWTYLKLVHTPHALMRDAFEECLGKHPALMERNIRHRFRHSDHFDAEEYHYIYLQRQHRLSKRDPGKVLFYLEPRNRKGYVLRKLARLRAGHYKFCCFNNLNQATEEELNNIKAEVTRILGIT
jgi:hypothetical protein